MRFLELFFEKWFWFIFPVFFPRNDNKWLVSWNPVHPGENVVKRKSTESAVTIPYGQTFRNIDRERPGGEQTGPGGQLQEISPESYE